MPRPISRSELLNLILSPEFHALTSALVADGAMAVGQALHFWNSQTSAERREIYRQLIEISRLSNLPDTDDDQLKIAWPRTPNWSDCDYDHDDQNWIDIFKENELKRPVLKRDGLFAIPVHALLPVGIIGDEPLLKCRGNQINYSQLAAALSERIPATGIIKLIDALFCAAFIRRNQFYPAFDNRDRHGWEEIPFPSDGAERSANFSKHSLREFYENYDSNSKIEISRIELGQILGSADFLTSHNAFLFMAEIHRRYPDAVDWHAQNYNPAAQQLDIAGSPSSATFTDERGRQILVVFAGCLNEGPLRNQFPAKGVNEIHFW